MRTYKPNEEEEQQQHKPPLPWAVADAMPKLWASTGPNKKLARMLHLRVNDCTLHCLWFTLVGVATTRLKLNSYRFLSHSVKVFVYCWAIVYTKPIYPLGKLCTGYAAVSAPLANCLRLACSWQVLEGLVFLAAGGQLQWALGHMSHALIYISSSS